MTTYLPGRFTAADGAALASKCATITAELCDEGRTETFDDVLILGVSGVALCMAIDVETAPGVTALRPWNVFLAHIREVTGVREVGSNLTSGK